MKYMLLIHQGESPTPRSPEEWARLPEDEQKAVFADYQAINETPVRGAGPLRRGLTPSIACPGGLPLPALDAGRAAAPPRSGYRSPTLK